MDEGHLKRLFWHLHPTIKITNTDYIVIMMLNVKNLLLFSCLGFVCGQLIDPYEDGPHQVLYKFYDLDVTGLDKNVAVWAPPEAGNYPVILLTGSLAGNVPGSTSIITVIEKVVSWGFVIVNPWRIYSTPGHNYHFNYVDPILEYLRDRLEDDFKALGADESGFSINMDELIFMGHSSGNHINVNYLKDHCGNFTAAIMLSPVDGTDPYGLGGDFSITPGQKLNFNLPTLVMQAGLDPIKGTILYPACAPAKLSNMRFYEAMAGDRWFVNATAYGHVDFFESDFVGTIDILNFCATDSATNKTVYQDFIAGSIVAFSKAMLEPETYCDMLTFVENTELMLVDTVAENDVKNRCKPAECSWTSTTTENSLNV